MNLPLRDVGPWVEMGLGPDDLTIERVSQALAVSTREIVGWNVSEYRSAVLVALIESNGILRTILTKRSRNLRRHSGEISFPGGRGEPPDRDPVETALREAQEEVGLDPELARALGCLDTVTTAVTSVEIVPVVAAVEKQPVLAPKPDEVETIFVVSLHDLAFGGAYRRRIWNSPFGERLVDSFELPEGQVVWGATARILRNLFEVIAASPAPRASAVDG